MMFELDYLISYWKVVLLIGIVLYVVGFCLKK
jgi:hypothetical protein